MRQTMPTIIFIYAKLANSKEYFQKDNFVQQQSDNLHLPVETYVYPTI